MADLNTGSSYPQSLAVFDGQLYFSAEGDSGGYELWTYDTGTDSAWMVTDLYPGGSSSPMGPFIYDSTLQFSAIDGISQNLWSYAGTGDPVKAFTSTPTEIWDYSDAAVFDGKVFFEGYEGITGAELWSWDGMNAPSMVSDINTDLSSTPGQFFVY